MQSGHPISSAWGMLGCFVLPMLAATFCSVAIPIFRSKHSAISPLGGKNIALSFLVSTAQATDDQLTKFKTASANGAVLNLSDESTDLAAKKIATQRILAAHLPLYYWIEIGRCPELADAHPEWMASIQTHTEWRRRFPDFPKEAEGEVVKAWPWVPVLYQETFAAHLDRVGKLLGNLPVPKGIFLSDLQGPPSACGCGHPLCRWTADYGPIKTASPLGPDAAARFCAEVKKLAPNAEVIPVWTSECEETDRETVCGGVGCYRGTCWKEWTKQITPVAAECPRIAALLPYKLFARDLPIYGGEGAWISHAVRSFGETPQGNHPVAANHLIAVAQGWDVTPDQIDAQKLQATKAGCAGIVVAINPIEQSWEPRLFRWKK
jgi:hypothetical protein